MNPKAVATVVLLAVALGFGMTSFKKSVTPYVSFRDARQANGQVQVNGVLADKNYVMKRDTQYLEFKLKDDHGEVMNVEYHGVVPGNFDQATSIVAIGHYENNRFHAEQLLVKCPSKYQTKAETVTS